MGGCVGGSVLGGGGQNFNMWPFCKLRSAAPRFAGMAYSVAHRSLLVYHTALRLSTLAKQDLCQDLSSRGSQSTVEPFLAAPRQVCLALLERFGLVAGQYQLGKTKVFFRPGVLGLVEDRWGGAVVWRAWAWAWSLRP